MLDRALEATLPALLALLDVSGDDPQWQALDPPQRRQRMLDAVKRLLLREAQVQPLLVVFEDLHWIDSETQALLDSLVESLPPARLLLFVNYRPEYEHRWGSKTSYTQLRLDPLPPESAVELLHGLLGEDRTIEPLTPILIERTEGNPFFLEETVRALVETKALVGERGAYRLAKVLTDIQVPPTVQAILAARIDRLSPEDKRLLQSAAVIGKDVPFALLAAIAERARGGAAPRARPSPGGRVPLRGEPLPRPRVHASSTRSRTRWRTAVCYTSADERSTRGSWTRSRCSIPSASASRSSGSPTTPSGASCGRRRWTISARPELKAAARSALPDARAWFEQALDVLETLPESPSTLEQAFDIRLELRPVLLQLGEVRRMLRAPARGRDPRRAAER